MSHQTFALSSTVAAHGADMGSLAMVKLARLGLILLMVLGSGTARADDLAELFSNNSWGSRGGFHLQAARAVRTGSLSVVLANAYASGTDVLTRGDTDSQTSLGMHLLWSPFEGFELGGGQTSIVNKYENIVPTSLQLLGNPTFLAKYSIQAAGGLGLGWAFELTVPTSQGGSGLTFGAATTSVTGLASYQPLPFLDLTGNVGYIYDRSATLSGGLPTPLQRYVFGLWDLRHRLSYGLGAAGQLDLRAGVSLSPFAELWGQYASASGRAGSPFAATLGLKAFPSLSRMFQAVVGVDCRLAGAPGSDRPAPGLPKWLAFAQVDFHFGEAVQSADLVTVPRCVTDAECGGEHVCEAQACVRVVHDRVEVVKEVVKEVVREAIKETPTVALAGVVVDAATGRPVAGAEVTVNRNVNPITVNAVNGRFDVCPAPADGGLTELTVRALGYDDERVVVPRSAHSTAETTEIRLRAAGSAVMGVFRGSVTDSATGAPVPSVSVFVPALKLRIPTAADGSFNTALRVGRYQVLVSAPGYATQAKKIVIEIDQVVISNIDLVKNSHHK